jgi:hypothetical protein
MKARKIQLIEHSARKDKEEMFTEFLMEKFLENLKLYGTLVLKSILNNCMLIFSVVYGGFSYQTFR